VATEEAKKTERTASQVLGDLKNALAAVGPLGTTIGAVAGAGVVYVIGGMVSVIRLRQAHLPVEQGLDVIPREQLLLIGAREVILVLALSLGLFLLLDRIQPPRCYSVLAILALASLLLAPLTRAGLVWPVAILAVLGLWWLHERGSTVAFVAIPIVILLVVAFRYDDPPPRFFQGNVWTSEAPRQGCRYDRPNQVGRRASYCGVFLGVTGDHVYLGLPGRDTQPKGKAPQPREIVGLPKDTVKKLVLTEFSNCPARSDPRPPGCVSAPRLSLVGRVTRRLGLSGISCIPLECWIGRKNHGRGVFG
jgi:hypothetical protein